MKLQEMFSLVNQKTGTTRSLFISEFSPSIKFDLHKKIDKQNSHPFLKSLETKKQNFFVCDLPVLQESLVYLFLKRSRNRPMNYGKIKLVSCNCGSYCICYPDPQRADKILVIFTIAFFLCK